MAEILKGAPAAARLNKQTMEMIKELRERGVVPTLAIVRAGERGDDLAYEHAAQKRCLELGGAVRSFSLPQEVPRKQMLSVIREINEDPLIHGCLLLRPLPSQIDDETVRAALDPSKDCDGITAGSLAGVFTAGGQGYPPCTARAVIELLDYYGIGLSGRRVTVLGRSLVVGRPLSMLLLSRNATVTICHTHTRDLAGQCRTAEILITAAGHVGLVDASFVSPGQIVIDVGVNISPEGKLVGDVCFNEVEPIVQMITPTPGGVGSVTTSVLVRQMTEAAIKKSVGC